MVFPSISGFAWWMTGVVLIPTFPGCIIYTVITDEFLNEHIILVLFLSFIVFCGCCSFNLTALFILRLKQFGGVPDDFLVDLDMESDDEIPADRPRWNFKEIIGFLLRNYVTFCQMHVAYNIIALFGILGLMVTLILCICKEWTESQKLQEELFYSANHLLIPGVVLPAIVGCLANIPNAYKLKAIRYSYTPFDYEVNVPLKVVVRQTMIVLITGGKRNFLHLFFGLVFVAYGIYNILSFLAKPKDFEKWQNISQVLDIKPFILVTVGFTLIFGIYLLIRLSYWCFIRVKETYLRTMEQNWQRNMFACRFLLSDTAGASLDAMKTRLDIKARQTEGLTNTEKQALDYIFLPLWKSKRAFI